MGRCAVHVMGKKLHPNLESTMESFCIRTERCMLVLRRRVSRPYELVSKLSSNPLSETGPSGDDIYGEHGRVTFPMTASLFLIGLWQ